MKCLDGLSSYEALREYSIEFQGGQTNMFIVDAEKRERAQPNRSD